MTTPLRGLVRSSRGSVRHQVRLACPVETAWELLGDPVRLPEWMPGIESCTIEGGVRTVVTVSGLPIPERLLTVDPLAHRLQYRITSPLLTEHLGSIDVLGLGDGTCLVVSGTDADPGALALVIGGAVGAGLRRLPELLGLDPLPLETVLP
ncbi:MAG: SRPBCC family protein, partial [Acidimicrobiales bacterium]